mgnify:CR=1 FL=1|jgi:hypothetical protein
MPLNRLENNVISTRNMINELQVSTNSVYTNIAENDTPTIIQNSEIEVEAGMNLTAGWLVAIKDNLAYKATNFNSDNLQPIGVVKSTVLDGAIATVILSGIINTSLTLTTYPDSPIYIRSGNPNYSQTLLTSASGTEDLIQKIGYPITANSFLLKIENYTQII